MYENEATMKTRKKDKSIRVEGKKWSLRSDLHALDYAKKTLRCMK